MKTTPGREFLKAFINLRDKEPYCVANAVEKYLKRRKHKVESSYLLGGSLVHQFFQSGKLILINPDRIKKDATMLLGKGVCFDTGGYNLKHGMDGMFFDKNGALLAIAAALDNGVPAAVFFVDNMIHCDAPVQGEILKEPITGKHVLIDDTDAEGRIGLASLLADYTRSVKGVITIATLTGAAVNFTGERTYGLVHSNRHEDLMSVLKAKLELWPAPTHKDYDDAVLTKVKGADVRSCGKFKGAGSSTAFSFLKHFNHGKHHIHLDMAAMMNDKDGNGLVWGLPEVKYLLGLMR